MGFFGFGDEEEPVVPALVNGDPDPIVDVITFAGSGDTGYAEGTGEEAKFHWPEGVAVDVNGYVYVADTYNHRIRKITPEGVVSTLAGSGLGYAEGTGEEAKFNLPRGMAVDGAGNVYVADSGNHRIRMISPQGVVSTFAGSGEWGHLDGKRSVAKFNEPRGVAVDGAGNVYVADYNNHRIRKIISSTGEVSTFAGTGANSYLEGHRSVAQFSYPRGVAVDHAGNVYVAEYGKNNRIRKISSEDDRVTSLIGSSITNPYELSPEQKSFLAPADVAVDGAGNIYVPELDNQRIRKISPTGDVTILAGSENGVLGYANGPGKDARFWSPTSVAVDVNGNVYVAEGAGNNRIRKITITTP
jgi:DNA-binding beta-propeller fold protein YncE